MVSIGFVCEPDHPTFWPVAERLAARGFDIEFLRPTDPICRADVDGLEALVNGVLHPESFGALRYADQRDVPTWNGFLSTTAFASRVVALDALDAIGCRVPDVHFDGPKTGFEAASPFAWRRRPTGRQRPSFYVESVRTEPVDHRYYAVDDGRETHVRALAIRTSLSGTGEPVSQTDVDVMLATRVRELLERFGARAVGVDFTRGEDGEFYALRTTPVPTFAGTDMGRRVADSVASLTTLGA
ncbi:MULTISPECIES: hypothetical protein [Haloarcula]|uniref:ATP-grasp domain-containing protein n=1 Tax=Haloarcula pellucida TaxID=1427151 RepID=A0A830GGL7_9EURY|nr:MULTISPECIES: hypothetical protein [Halomicroarcula]MBX0346791.1 hypothetical protein [Halomicroarcula pellucida]MDS0277331.1 hypothetical protein [Halomicroarcula sp. S1AR25-4]GGN85527.1 hypothetical protein GCM10009030_02090 [Halomicroarcula pellucida]